MSLQVQRIRKRRTFSEDFKRKIVKDFEGGHYSVGELCALYDFAPQTVYNWIYRYSRLNKTGYRVVEKKESARSKVKDLENRIKELERLVGQKQIMVDYYETMIDLAKEEFDIDIKKNSNTPPSGDSKKKR
jgi:transposase